MPCMICLVSAAGIGAKVSAFFSHIYAEGTERKTESIFRQESFAISLVQLDIKQYLSNQTLYLLLTLIKYFKLSKLVSHEKLRTV
jgi:hypothetical protein